MEGKDGREMGIDELVWCPDQERYAPLDGADAGLPVETYSEIVPGLWQGGTDDRDGCSTSGGVDEFDAVVTLYAWADPCCWGTEELRYGFPDATSDLADMVRVVRAARWAYERWQSGDRVLVRCQAGLNRSGLVTALVLMLAGTPAGDAIALIRARRSPAALINASFVGWLHQEAANALGAPGLAA